jgi:hypothetical protein
MFVTICRFVLVFLLFSPSLHAVNQTHESLRRRKCSREFGVLSFLNETDERLPPVLYSFPGSGNTWCRLLIEYSTRIYTGSLYDDQNLLRTLPGEAFCDQRVSVVKAHPDYTHATKLFPRISGKGKDHGNSQAKCLKGKISSNFHRAIILIRNPYDAIWSDYLRRISHSHAGGIPISQFQQEHGKWKEISLTLAKEFSQSVSEDFRFVERTLPISDRIVIRYEDLRNSSLQAAVLFKVNEFLRLPSFVASETSSSSVELQRRLECAFLLAENPQTHRAHPTENDYTMSKEMAYSSDPGLVCNMWKRFENEAMKYGYQIWNGTQCSE